VIAYKTDELAPLGRREYREEFAENLHFNNCLIIMSVSSDHQLAKFQYSEPDTSRDPWDCDFFAAPIPKSISTKELVLHDIRSEKVEPRLETHGFQVIRHKSTLFGAEYSPEHFRDENVEKIYLPEVIDVVKREIGASEVFALNCAVRRDPPETPSDPVTNGGPCGVPIDLNSTDLGKPVLPSAAPKLPPARDMHIDYSPNGARQILRKLRKDIRDASVDIIAAEDAAAAQGNIDEYQGRRYAFLSFWRPLRTVSRDPLAVLDITTFDADKELTEFVNKQPGADGAFIAGLYLLQGHKADQHRWMWISEQKTDEVLLISFFDSYAVRQGRSPGTPHGSPELSGITTENWRNSIEVRLLALW
jgi:hypothetical protein